MCVVRILGMIFLAVYLFFNGLFMATDMQIPPVGTMILGLVGMTAGVLILISVGTKKDKTC